MPVGIKASPKKQSDPVVARLKATNSFDGMRQCPTDMLTVLSILNVGGGLFEFRLQFTDG
jgi:hypothetical protein